MKDFEPLKKQPFLEWMADVYGDSPVCLLDLFKQTSLHPRKDFEKAMEWYRRRYRASMQLREAYAAVCPFPGGSGNDIDDNKTDNQQD